MVWNNLTIPTPTVSGNKRTYTVDLSKADETWIVIDAQSYSTVDTRIIKIGTYCVSFSDIAYYWYGRITVTTTSVIVETLNTNSQAPLVLNAIKYRIWIYFFNGRGYSDAASLDNAEAGAWRYTSLAASNSSSGSDTEGILLVFNAIRNDGVNSVNTQIFIGYIWECAGIVIIEVGLS